MNRSRQSKKGNLTVALQPRERGPRPVKSYRFINVFNPRVSGEHFSVFPARAGVDLQPPQERGIHLSLPSACMRALTFTPANGKTTLSADPCYLTSRRQCQGFDEFCHRSLQLCNTHSGTHSATLITSGYRRSSTEGYRGMLTVIDGAVVRAGYSAYLEATFETKDIPGRPARA
jgi:hypothetical protein